MPAQNMIPAATKRRSKREGAKRTRGANPKKPRGSSPDCSTFPNLGDSVSRVPWLMSSIPSMEGYWKFYDMVSNKEHKLHLPELKETNILGSSEGWLILADLNTANLQLFNPFSREQIDLPPTITFPGIVGTHCNRRGNIMRYRVQYENILKKEKLKHVSFAYFRNAILISSSCGYIVVVQYELHYRDREMFGLTCRDGDKHGLAFARAGDNSWTALPEIPKGRYTCMFFKSLLYAMDTHGRVFSFDFGRSGSPPVPLPVAPTVSGIGVAYLGNFPRSGELLQVRLESPNMIRAFRLDHKAVEWVDTSSSLGGHSLFCVQDLVQSMVCLHKEDLPQRIKGDCIYIVIDSSLRAWDMEDQTIEPYDPTSQNSKEVCHLIECIDSIWIDPVLTNLSVQRIWNYQNKIMAFI